MLELGGFELRDPLFLLVGLLALPVYWLASRLPSVVTYSSLSLVDGAPRSLRSRLAGLPALLLSLAVAALAIALAGPRTGEATSPVHRAGIAIAMVVDRSGSMQARDFVQGDTSVSRLDVVKQVFRDFVEKPGRIDDMIGLVTFARYADGACPLTGDHGNLLAILEQQEIVTERQEDGTAVGEGLALAVERLRHQEVRSKVAILLTDGVSNAGDITPLQASELAVRQGIKVYTIGAGRTGWAPVPVQLPGGSVGLRRAFVEIDEETLREIAERTQARYFHADDAEALGEVIEEIDRLERSEINEVRYLEYEPHYAVFVIGAIAFMLASSLLSGSWLRRLP
ncbi:MAG: VWA domain-containing protein [Myxococcota bacterium]|nr:VWA domain-containing protein [Myxococcota bacterium]